MANVKKDKVTKVQKTRVTLVGNVNVDEVTRVLSGIPGLEVKIWKKRGRSVSKKTVESAPEVAA